MAVTRGTKRKVDDSSSPAKASKEQKTLEETISKTNEDKNVEDNEDEGIEVNGDAKSERAEETTAAETKQDTTNGDKEHAEESVTSETKQDTANGNEENALDNVKADAGEAGKTTQENGHKEDTEADTTDIKADAVKEDAEREKALPSNILEKGIIYFFTRGRVGVEDPDSVQDLARSYFVLRPLPGGAKLTDGAIQDVGNNRLFALPKKVWPKSGKDRFMVFVEKAKVSMETLKEEFFQGSEYTTKTTGTRQTPDVTPVGEGVYAITSTGGGQGTTHLAYMLTIPSEAGEVQADVGLKAKGSFVLSLKNPESSAPANAQIGHDVQFSKEIMDEFRGRGWMPAQPKHLDYDGASMLVIGEDFDSSSNLDPVPKDEKDEVKKTPQEELEKLEEEDEHRVQSLKGDDTIFADLGISSKEYPKVLTTW